MSESSFARDKRLLECSPERDLLLVRPEFGSWSISQIGLFQVEFSSLLKMGDRLSRAGCFSVRRVLRTRSQPTYSTAW